MELKTMPTKFDTSTDGEIHGYASVFGNRDTYGDIVQKGAFARTINNDRGRIKVLWQHDYSNPIGIPLEMTEDEHGLHVKARIADTAAGRDALALMRAGVVNELSIGYDAVREEYDNETNTRHLKEVRLWEFSPVTWAANELAKITSVKQASDLDLILDRLERLKWTHGRLESERLRSRVKTAITNLDALLVDQTPDPSLASPSGTPDTPDAASNDVHAVLGSLSALNQKLTAASVTRELRAFAQNLKGNQV